MRMIYETNCQYYAPHIKQHYLVATNQPWQPLYHANASDIPSGAPSIASHTPNSHANGTSSDVYSSFIQGYDQRSLLSDLDGVAIFDEGVNSILENDAPPPQTNIPTGTPSIMTCNPDCHAKVTTSDVGISIRDSVRDQRSLVQLDIDGLGLFGEG
eukprot:scaffold48838_cov66-Attheya_sp.AAC.3